MTGIQLLAGGCLLRWILQRYWPHHLLRGLTIWCAIATISLHATGDHLWATAYAAVTGYAIGALQFAPTSNETTEEVT